MAKHISSGYGDPKRIPNAPRDGLRAAKPCSVHASVLSLAVILSALAQHGCKICSCAERPGAQTPGAALAATSPAQAAQSGGNVTYNWKNVVVLGGGFVSGIIFSPVEKDLIYARTDVGGAYRWNQADKSWTSITDEFGRDANSGIESLAADPVDANKVYLAAGNSTGSWAGNGYILRSSDRGNTWQKTDMPLKMGGNEDGRSNGERLAIDPNLTSVLFFGSRQNGLWKSNDSGASWDKVGSFSATDSGNGVGIPIVLYDKSSGAKGKPTPIIYAGVANKDGSLFRSTDAGGTWKLVPKQPMGVMASHAELDSTGVMYISYGNGPGPNNVTEGAVWKYEPKSEKFTNITPAAPKKDDGFGYGGLSVDAAHPGTVMVSTIDRWTHGDEVYRTTDGGKNWKALLPRAVRDDAGAKYLYWHKQDPIGRGWMGWPCGCWPRTATTAPRTQNCSVCWTACCVAQARSSRRRSSKRSGGGRRRFRHRFPHRIQHRFLHHFRHRFRPRFRHHFHSSIRHRFRSSIRHRYRSSIRPHFRSSIQHRIRSSIYRSLLCRILLNRNLQ